MKPLLPACRPFQREIFLRISARAAWVSPGKAIRTRTTVDWNAMGHNYR